MTRINETSLSRIWSQMLKFDVGTITAFRHASECNEGTEYTKAQNRTRNKVLLASLQRKGYGITSALGSYKENYKSENEVTKKEEIFIVVDNNDTGRLKKDLFKLGEQFEQDSILYVPKGGSSGYLIGTNNCPNGYPGYRNTVKLKSPLFGQDGEFYTRVNGRPFTLLSVDEQSVPDTKGFFGKWSQAAVADYGWRKLNEQVDD